MDDRARTEGMNALRDVMTAGYRKQDPAVTIECAKDAIVKLLDEVRKLKAENADVCAKLAFAEYGLDAAEKERDALLAQRENPTAWCAIGKGGWGKGCEVSPYLNDASRWHAEGKTVFPLYQ